MQIRLEPTAYNKDSVNDNSTENRRCHGSAVLRVIGRAHHRVVVCLEEGADNGEDYDREDGYDDACPCLHHAYDWLHLCSVVSRGGGWGFGIRAALAFGWGGWGCARAGRKAKGRSWLVVVLD